MMGITSLPAKVQIILVAFTVISAHFTFPPSWIQVCKVTSTVDSQSRTISLNCSLTGDDQIKFNLKTLNDYTANITENIRYIVDIRCFDGGNLSMSWPMKIDKMAELHVKGCEVWDYMKDWNNTELNEIPDTLEVLTLTDSNNVVNHEVLFASLTNVKNMSKEFSCGHDETLRKIIYRNISISFNIDEELFQRVSDPVRDQVKLVNDVFDYKPICKYLHLKFLENSHTSAMTVYHVNVATQNSKYPHLKYLNYSNNRWREISETLLDWRKTFPQLKYLDLTNNRISKVPMKNRFDVEYGDDTVIDVRYNNITVLTTEDVLEWSRLDHMIIDIRDNPIDCDCLKQEFIFRVQDNDWFQGNLLKYRYIQDMTCATPPSARGKTIKSLSIEDMGCPIPPVDLTVPLVVLAVVAVTVVFLIISIAKFRREIKIILYTRFGVLFPWDVDDRTETKKYDAFVSYSTEDEDWIYDVLQKNLEQPTADGTKSFKLCLHQRDFIGGKTILDNIIDSIENSRHSIVVLSNNFIQSIWGMEEFKQAYYQSIVKKRRHMIIVKYGDVSETQLDPMLKRCLRTFTYLEVKESMFIDRLRFALVVKNQSNKN